MPVSEKNKKQTNKQVFGLDHWSC